MLDQHIIRSIHSPWSAPVSGGPKKTRRNREQEMATCNRLPETQRQNHFGQIPHPKHK